MQNDLFRNGHDLVRGRSCRAAPLLPRTPSPPSHHRETTRRYRQKGVGGRFQGSWGEAVEFWAFREEVGGAHLHRSVNSLRFLSLLLWFVLGPGGLREAPGRPTDGSGGPPRGPRTPPAGSRNLKAHTCCRARLSCRVIPIVGTCVVWGSWSLAVTARGIRGTTDMHYPIGALVMVLTV